ncbi:hypothetical protein CH373_05355 [Leptospira perolatii]|uniref:Photosynthetic protein synthase II n=1 Tax=Leptospira perolatii TaxID=2023191 RepID=A0A2M9ZQK7_9LEPT|nr:SCO family protein [Leptospira perolatii]PJZ70498.1 hypothetical protein CH360_05775 [Leptospira perolatii]PJZ74334.1 hypothetical protein CH373_05355 [Leptospira perolatii]
MKALCFVWIVSLFFIQCKDRGISSEYPKEVTSFSEKGEGLPFFTGKDMRPTWDSEEARRLEDFQGWDQKGVLFGSNEMNGKICVVSFFFSKCAGICPMITRNLLSVQEKYKERKGMLLVSFSITPDLDTSQKLNSFAKERKILYNKWRLLTGDKKKIYSIARNSFNADIFSPRENQEQGLSENDFLHSESLFLLDRKLRIRGVYNGRMPSSIQELTEHAEILMEEDSKKSI